MPYPLCKPAWTRRFAALVAAGTLSLGPAADAVADAAAPAGLAAPAASFLSYSGSATMLGSDKFIYGEEHFMRFQGGRVAERVVLYKCRNGAPFARKHLVYVTPLAPDFELLDVSNGLHEGVRSTAAGREIFYRESAADRERSGPLPQVSGLVGDAGFDEFVRANWGPLMAGEKRRLDFVIPSRLDVMSFQVRHVEAADVGGVAAEMFRLRLSGFLGLLLPSIDVYYSSADHLLVRYDGLSNLHDASGSIYKAHILFPPSSRKASDDPAMRKALQTPLARCR